MTDDLAYDRLDNQIEWYDKRASSNKGCYVTLRIVVIVMGALIPISSALWSMQGFEFTRWISAAAGFFIVVAEGVQQVLQFQQNWRNYRSTAEALKHEKHLFLGLAGPYSAADNPRQLLVERTEMLISREHATWITDHKRGS